MEYQPKDVSSDYQKQDGKAPFEGQSELEITVKKAEVARVETDKAGAICAYFICDLPFDC